MSKPSRSTDPDRGLGRPTASLQGRAAQEPDDEGFDPSAIARLREEVLGTSDLQELDSFLGDCLQDVDALVTQAETAGREADTEVLARSAHTLKSNGALIGAMTLSQLGERLQHEATTLPTALLAPRAADLRAAFERYRRQYARHRATLGPREP